MVMADDIRLCWFIGLTAIQCWSLIRAKQLSMAATARVIFQCACVRYLLGRVPPFLPFKGDVTQDDSQSRFLEQQRVAALLRHFLIYSRYEIALCSSKNRRPVQQVTLPLWVFSGAHNSERATPILGLCHGVFTGQFIFRHIFGHFFALLGYGLLVFYYLKICSSKIE